MSKPTQKKRKRRGRLPSKQINYIACEGWEFGWKHPQDLERLKQYWEAGKSYKEIAREFRRPEGEVVAYIFDQWEKGNLPDRPNGIFGKKWRRTIFEGEP